MNDRSSSSVAIVAVIVALLLLFGLFGGAAVLLFAIRSRAQVEQLEMARMEAQAAEQMARVQAERSAAMAEELAARERLANQSPTAGQSTFVAADVQTVFDAQVAAWNAGDIDAFMEHYWKSDELTFSSGGKTTRGWNATQARYRERYPTPEKMGRLKFEQLEITPLGDTAALVLGHWHLEREPEPLTGNYSIVFRKIDGRWLIVHDHTSRLAE